MLRAKSKSTLFSIKRNKIYFCHFVNHKCKPYELREVDNKDLGSPIETIETEKIDTFYFDIYKYYTPEVYM